MLALFLATYYILSIWKFLFNSVEFSPNFRNSVQLFPEKFFVWVEIIFFQLKFDKNGKKMCVSQ
jgi:hypothetical protein